MLSLPQRCCLAGLAFLLVNCGAARYCDEASQPLCSDVSLVQTQWDLVRAGRSNKDAHISWAETGMNSATTGAETDSRESERARETRLSQPTVVSLGEVACAAVLVGAVLWALTCQMKSSDLDGSQNQQHALASLTAEGPSLALQHMLSSTGVVALIEAQAEERPHSVSLVSGDGHTMTYKELVEAARTLADALSRTLGEGQVVALLLHPSAELVISTLGVMRAKSAWLPLAPESPGTRNHELAVKAGARLVLCHEQAVMDDLDLPFWTLSYQGLTGEQMAPWPPVAADPCLAGAAIFYTSGTSGSPKAVIHSAEAVLHGAAAVCDYLAMGPSTVALSKCPAAWITVEWEALSALLVGGRVVYDKACRNDMQRLAQVLKMHQVTVLVSSDRVMQFLPEVLADPQAQTLLHVVNVGGKVSLETCRALHRALPSLRIHNYYGCTESACTVWSFHKDAKGDYAPAGSPQPEVTVHLVDSNLELVTAGQTGEIVFGGKYNASGYLGDAEGTARKFVQLPTGERVYRTGDLGRIDRDCLHVLGRIDRQMNFNNLRVSPEEIEGTILRLPDIVESAIVAGDSEHGFGLVAFVVSQGKGSDDDVVEAVNTHCSKFLPSHMIPRFVRVLDNLPKLANGKVDYVGLRHEAHNLLSEDMVESVDSLGMGAIISRTEWYETQAFAAARTVGMITVILYHWLWLCGYASYGDPNTVQPTLKADIPASWLRYLLRGNMQSFWGINIFVLTSAWTDQKGTHSTQHLIQELIALVLLLALHWPVPVIWEEVNQVLSNNLPSILKPHHRWYFVFFLFCRRLHHWVFTPLRAFLNSSAHSSQCRAAVVACFLAFSLAAPGPPDLCQGAEEGSLRVKLLHWFVDEYGGNTCPLWFDLKTPCYFAVYAATWWYGPDVLAVAQRQEWILHLSPWVPVACFLVSTIAIGFIDEARWAFWPGFATQSTTRSWTQFPPFNPLIMTSIDVMLALLLLLGIVLSKPGAPSTSLASWLSNRAAELGKYMLAVYAFHWFFAFEDPTTKIRDLSGFRIGGHTIVPSMTSALEGSRPWSSVAQFCVLLAYPIGFFLIFGPILHFLLMAVVLLPRSFTALRSLLLRMRSGKQSQESKAEYESTYEASTNSQ